MSIYIKGMEMPKDVTLLAISPDGTVDIISGQPDLMWKTLKHKAISVPPHGNLGDLDALKKKAEWANTDDDTDVRVVRLDLYLSCPYHHPGRGG